MNILSFDIEDWYNCDFISGDLNWDRHEVRIYEGVERILEVLNKNDIQATFFCLGWIAEKHPKVVRWISDQGHHMACHSYQHELSFRFDKRGFKEDTEKAKKLIEDTIGTSVNAYRAPGFSIRKDNIWAFEVLAELGFVYDCSVFPAAHDYGGFAAFGAAEPVIIQLRNGLHLKEFPMSIKKLLGKPWVFSGGGFFRLFPYWLIRHWARNTPYMMAYFHPRDFDPGQPVLRTLPFMRKTKSYAGLSTAFHKFQKYLNDFDFVSVSQADELIHWNEAKVFSPYDRER